jgi:glycosyltransferase involved in cell wall biosynthesis
MSFYPLVSIIVPCYNQAQYLPESINSVLSQSYSNWECIIVNDGSPDNTELIASELCKKDQRIKYLKKENGGLSDARNFGIRNSYGEYILPLDADDKIGERYLELAMKEFLEKPETKIVYCDAEYFGDKQGQLYLPDFNLPEMLYRNLLFCSSFFKRVDYDKTNGYDTKLKAFEDFDFWLQLLEDGGTVVKIPSIQFYYRIRKNSMLRSLSDLDNSQIKLTIFNKHKDLYLKIFPNMIEVLQTLNKLQTEYYQIKNSKSYRIGKTILWPFQKLLKR